MNYDYDWIMVVIICAWIATVGWLAFKDSLPCSTGVHAPDYKTMKWGEQVTITDCHGVKYASRKLNYVCKRCGHTIEEVAG